MPSIAGQLPPLGDALESLHKASQTPVKQRTVKVSGVVDAICRHAFADGLDEDALETVVHIAARKTELDQTSVTTLIKNLYPAQRVSGDVVVIIVAALGQGQGKPSPGTQDSLVKWLALVHEIMENANVLSRLYGVLFGMLDMISIRTSLCHLLSLITRRKHVKPFRIQQLLELSRGLGNEPALQGLLRVYKDYYPDVILGSASTSRKSFAPTPDAEWRERVRAIQETRTAADNPTSKQHNGFKVLRHGPKRTKASVLPDVHTYHAIESSVTLEGIDTVESFVEMLDRIEPPGQLVSFLTDPLLQKYVDLRPSPVVSARISLWLATCLEDQIASTALNAEDPALLTELLDGLLQHARYTKTLLPIVPAFLREYLATWNGNGNIEAVLGLLAYIPGSSFEDVYSEFLAPAERALLSNGISSYTCLAGFYTDMLQHRVAILAQEQPERRQPALSSPEQQFLKDSVSHFATFSTSMLLSPPSSIGAEVISSILAYWELLSTSSKPNVIPILLPPMHLVYYLMQSSSADVVSRTCGIIGSYKQAFDAHPRPVKHYYPSEVTDGLNWCLRDVYNFFWVARGLAVAEQKSVGMHCHSVLRSSLDAHLKRLDRNYAISHVFNLSHNAWLASMSSAAWHALEEEEIDRQGHNRATIKARNGPVTQQSLASLKNGGISVDWDGADGYKVFVLNWLAERGLGGLRALMFATVTDLKTGHGTS
ncbi:Mis6-domain-containing protein [Didymella exigua CBS 183.55]|uniref:Mis6-domain-containing protein n=1 Tax=Didymella exigua CBS 183.55 TaxID=1150837 RepID=A0A6A5RAR7_9PLEO|nr:Mis6-domain-containing protein [Didymella exigua CBS 183.55]KAF1923756.1 Mis6-domain-containing protein [Didymella exigua CBS 183.55]